MKILYLSCHSILEYDEVKLLSEIGHDIFSMGAYHNPGKIDDLKRPTLDIKYFPELEKLATPDDKNNIPQAVIDWADIIICQHIADWLTNNWEKFKGKRVIWRSIGQSTTEIENQISPLRRSGLEIVRYSPREKTIPGFVGSDAMIRFYKDPEEFNNWNGRKKEVIMVGQDFKARAGPMSFDVFEKATFGLNRRVYGPKNENLEGLGGGCPDYEGLKRVLRDNRVFFYTGTQPASYTLGFIEALMTGTPVVAVGPYFGNSPYFSAQRTYEAGDIIQNGVNGFISDDIKELRAACVTLLENDELARQISVQGRATAIELFDKSGIKILWTNYLKKKRG